MLQLLHKRRVWLLLAQKNVGEILWQLVKGALKFPGQYTTQIFYIFREKILLSLLQKVTSLKCLYYISR